MQTTTQTLPRRSELAPAETWNVESLFPSPQAWEAELTALAGDLSGLEEFRGRAAESPAALSDWFRASEPVSARLRRLVLYAMLGTAVDAHDQAALGRQQRARALAARAAAATAFAVPEMIAAGVDTLRGWAAREPDLAVYAHHLDVLARDAPHVRSAEVEEVLGEAGAPLGTAASVHGILANAELRFAPARASDGTEHEVAQGTLPRLLGDPDRELRRTAWESYADAHVAFASTMAACVVAGCERQVFVARAGRYGSALEAALGRNHVPVAVFRTVVDTFRANLGTWHRYWRVRRRLLGLDRLHAYDQRAPLGGSSPTVPYARAVEMIAEAMAPLGDEYVSVLRHGATEGRWVDPRPNRGKRNGAFSASAPGSHPFVFMSYTDDVFSMSTLAHELGHAMHSHRSAAAQPFVYARYGLILAEVASNFNQALVRAHLLRTVTEPEVQLALVEEAISNFHRYYLVMPTLARFEVEVHDRIERGQAVTADDLTSLMADLLDEAYGGEVAADRERVGITWAQFHTHLCRDFYPYQYSTGIACAHALAEAVSEGRAEPAQRYLRFLESGSSRFPLDALREAGVDLATPEPVEQAFGVLGGYIDRLERLADSRGI
ncbi:MAG TPA: oligoendopeptidase F [Candidatus Dormibacteraeota bacterium]|nr:oligoendopeptidase F [Candidatus Dormibacteraeota bacterium]